MIRYVFVLCLCGLTLGQQSEPCANSSDLSSCFTWCRNNASPDFGTCNAQCCVCFPSPNCKVLGFNNSPTPELSSTSLCLCSDGSTACSASYTTSCIYKAQNLCFCGPCPGVTTCGVNPPTTPTPELAVPAPGPAAPVPSPPSGGGTSAAPAPGPAAPVPSPPSGGGTSAAPTPGPAAPVPSPPSGGGTSCIAIDQDVIIEGDTKIKLKDLKKGDRVLTDDGFQEYIGDIHDDTTSYTIVITADDATTIELTGNHLIRTNKGFVQARAITKNDAIMARNKHIKRIVNIRNGIARVRAPLTRSGTIIVNDIVLSCYAVAKSHYVANLCAWPIRARLISDITGYFIMLTKVHNLLHVDIRSYVTDGKIVIL